MFAATKLRFSYIYRDKRFLGKKIFCCDKHNFVETKGCRHWHTIVATKDVFCGDKHVFVATKIIRVAALYINDHQSIKAANDEREKGVVRDHSTFVCSPY